MGLVLVVVSAAPAAAQSPADSTVMFSRTLAEFWAIAAEEGDTEPLAGHPQGAPASFCLDAPLPAERLSEIREEVVARTGLLAADCVPIREQSGGVGQAERGYLDSDGRLTNYLIIRGPSAPADTGSSLFFVRIGTLDGERSIIVACGFSYADEAALISLTRCRWSVAEVL